MLNAVGEFAVGGCQSNLIFFLKGAHTVLIQGRCTANQDHRPAVLLCIGEPGKRMNHTRTGYHQAGLSSAGEITGCLRCVAGRLFITHADVGNSSSLRG